MRAPAHKIKLTPYPEIRKDAGNSVEVSVSGGDDPLCCVVQRFTMPLTQLFRNGQRCVKSTGPFFKPMTYAELAVIFSPLEQLGFNRAEVKLETGRIFYENETHLIDLGFWDLGMNVECKVRLNECSDAWVDGYSIIARHHPHSLASFLIRRIEFTDRTIAEFLSAELSGECSSVFRIKTREAWTELYAFHRLSVKRRNAAFWSRVSGHGETHYGAGPSDEMTF